MATYTVSKSKHATLGASTVDTVTLAQMYNVVEVFNRAATNPIFFIVGGDTPTVNGDNTEIVMPNTSLKVSCAGDDTVKLISTGAQAYSVVGR